ncbi:MAG: hypothetical protein PWP06_1725 [Candidatus Marinimicrobia bacterium]|jgi:hypothetical protein|nr:hypothetical protein [Candidatus Neomarinimicrobiota bacterium]
MLNKLCMQVQWIILEYILSKMLRNLKFKNKNQGNRKPRQASDIRSHRPFSFISPV